MTRKTADQLITLLAALFRHSREHAARFRALEEVARDHPEIFGEYEDRVREIETDAGFQKSHDRTAAALDMLRTALLQDHEP